jgi:ATP-dependent protease Clp ATPase subunit
VEYLSQHVVGQEFAKVRLAVSVYHHYKRIINNLAGQQPVAKDTESPPPLTIDPEKGTDQWNRNCEYIYKYLILVQVL